MNHALYILALVLFLLMAPLLLTLRAAFPKYMPWLLLFALAVIGGWVLINAAVTFYFAYLYDLIQATPHPSEALTTQWSDDGAKRVFALFFGWLYGLVYLWLWLIPYALFQGIRRGLHHLSFASKRRIADN